MALDGEQLRVAVAAAGLDADRLHARAPLPDDSVPWVLESRSPGWFEDWQALRDLVGLDRWFLHLRP